MKPLFNNINFEAFYGAYVKNYKKVNDQGLYCGRSPFGNGKIYTNYGGFYCEVKKSVGSPMHFLHELYPLMIEKGIENAIGSELTSYEPDSNGAINPLQKSFMDEYIAEYRASCKKNKRASQGYNPYECTPHFIAGGRVHHFDLGPNETPIFLYRWYMDTMFQKKGKTMIETYGVPRIHNTNHDTIWFAEDPISVETLKHQGKPVVYLRPTTEMYEWNDYQKLIDGKTVHCLRTIQKHNPLDPEFIEVTLETNDAIELLDIYDQPTPSCKKTVFSAEFVDFNLLTQSMMLDYVESKIR